MIDTNKCYECGFILNERYKDELRFSDIIYYNCTNEICDLLQHHRIPVKDRLKKKLDNTSEEM